MAGLLDFNDPNALNTLGLIGGLLSARKGDNWPLMLQQAAMRQEAIRRGQVDEEMRREQMAQAKKLQEQQAQRQAAIAALAQERPELAQLLQIDPSVGVQRAFPDPAKNAYTLGPGQQRFEGGKPVASVPQERKAPEGMQYNEQGQLVEIPGYVAMRSKIAAAGRAPSDAGKPPQGYRWRQDGGLEPIPGGPADPSTVQGKGQPSEAELVAAGYGQRMAKAEALVNQIGEAGHPTAKTMLAANTPLLNPSNKRAVERVVMSPQQQMYRQAQEDWVRAKLRKESGAVIAEDEMKREIETYFPQPGDSPEVIRQKAQSRAVAINAMSTASGRARNQMSPGGWGIRKLD